LQKKKGYYYCGNVELHKMKYPKLVKRTYYIILIIIITIIMTIIIILTIRQKCCKTPNIKQFR